MRVSYPPMISIRSTRPQSPTLPRTLLHSTSHSLSSFETRLGTTQDLVDAMDVASSVLERIEAVDKEGVDDAAALFRQKIQLALGTYVSACESPAGITIPDRMEKGGLSEERE
jgi:hypothetical protein